MCNFAAAGGLFGSGRKAAPSDQEKGGKPAEEERVGEHIPVRKMRSYLLSLSIVKKSMSGYILL
jgi:hypothetical protein